MRCLGSGQPLKTMLVYKGHAASKAILIWVVCAVTRAMSRSTVLLHLQSVLMSMAHVTKRVTGVKHVEN